MCASYEAQFSVTQLVEAFDKARAPLLFERGVPNIEPLDEVRPTDPARAVRALGEGRAELAAMRFGFPPPAAQGPQGKKRPPILNFRSEGRRFSNGPSSGRALVPASGFYEFTGDKYPKTRWRLRGSEGPFLALAALWRAGPDGDAFALLTGEPGPDVAPYHDRGVIPLPPDLWADWLFDRAPAEDLLRTPPAGTLVAEAAPRK